MIFRVLTVVVICSMVSAHARQFSARVSVRSERDVIALHQLGLEIADARIEEHIAAGGSRHLRPVYCPENGFVTVIGTRGEIEGLSVVGP